MSRKGGGGEEGEERSKRRGGRQEEEERREKGSCLAARPGATKDFPTDGHTSRLSVLREMYKYPTVFAAFLVYHDFIMIS